MKNNVKEVLIGVTIAVLIGACGFNWGYAHGYDTGCLDGEYKAAEDIEDWCYDNANGDLTSYYGYEGITVRYCIEKGNINDDL